MTNDEIRELISQARKSSDSLRNAPWGIDRESFADGVDRLADALEGTLTEPEWEYGTAHRSTPEYGASEYSRERAEERVREWNETTQSGRGLLVRRRKAGPWAAVPDV